MDKMDKTLTEFLEYKAYKLRYLSIIATTEAGSGHPTSCLSSADIVSALFFYVMKYDINNPKNPDNDRFILSKGHAAPLLYAAWEEAGLLKEEDLLTLRQFGSVLEGHPNPVFAGVEAATGSLGQGLSIGAGMALSAKMDKREFYTYVLLGDSEVSEGQIWEAAQVSAYYKLSSLIAILDVNSLGQTGATMSGYDTDQYVCKFEAFGWHTIVINGHNIPEIISACDQAHKIKDKPVIIIAKTVKGYGIKSIEGKNGFHGKAFSKEELPAVLSELKLRFPEASEYTSNDRNACSSLPDSSFGRTILRQAQDERGRDIQFKHIDGWRSRECTQTLPRHPECCTKYSVSRDEKYKLPEPVYKIGEEIQTRKAYGQALAQLDNLCPELVVLDAEVKNSTYAEILEQKDPAKFIQCFIAEQNMISMAVGLTTRNKVTFSSTFACFLTRAFDQLRMAAIGRIPLRVCGSHAGVSIGQDGPSQMGLEDIAMFRSLPDSVILYPSDAVSTYKSVELMANHNTSISYLRTTRSATPVIYANTEQFQMGGCKVLRKSDNDLACIIAAGITLHEALKAYEILAQEGIFISVIDLYCVKPLDHKTILATAIKANKHIITVEDHYLQGGLGEAITYELRDSGIKIDCLAVTKLPCSGKPEELLAFEDIDFKAIIKQLKKVFNGI